MKLAFCTNTFPLDEIPQACRRLKEIGYDGVELWHQYLVSRPLSQVQDEILGIGLEAAQLCPYFNVTGSREELENSYRLAEQYIGMAKALHCKNIRVFTGSVGAHEASAEQFEQGVRGLQTICDLGPDQMFVLETHPGSLMESADATLRLLKCVDRKNLRVNLQVPLRYEEENPYDCVEKLGSYTVHIHAHNWVGPASENHLTCLSDGWYDFEKFLTILYRHGFNGFVSIEHGDHYGRDDPFFVAEREHDFFVKIKRSIER